MECCFFKKRKSKNYCQYSSRYIPPTKHENLKLMNEKKISMTEKVARGLPPKSGSIAITQNII